MMEEDIRYAINTLKEGGTILYPTDTIWGIGCDATNPKAVNKVFRIKNRPQQKSFIILLDSVKNLYRYIDSVPGIAEQLFSVTDKPLTIILPGAKNLARNLLPEDGTIGVRIPQDPFCHKLITGFKKPVVSTSANKSGDIAPSCFSEIGNYIRNQVDYIVKWRQNETKQRKSSSILKVGLKGEIEIIRE